VQKKTVVQSLKEGKIVSLIGANGAGKTTTLQAISGLLKPRSGEITFLGNNLLATEAHDILKLGLAQMPEGRRIFSGLTVKKNLQMGAFAVRDTKENLTADRKAVYDRFPRLRERKKQMGGTLSGGEQQMLAIGRALMSRPKMLLLDEPSMGLAPILVKEIFEIIKEVNKSGVTILLVEQNAKMALSISNRAYVLETGRIVMSGQSSDLLENELVKKAYLGA
jgi:branched-chain amino acid transport system ATP-binding protein